MIVILKAYLFRKLRFINYLRCTLKKKKHARKISFVNAKFIKSERNWCMKMRKILESITLKYEPL